MIGPSNCRQMRLHSLEPSSPRPGLTKRWLLSSRRTRTVRRRATTLLHSLHRRRYFRPPVLPSSSAVVPPRLLLRWPGACGRAGSAATGQEHSRESTKTRRRRGLGARGHRQGQIWALAEALPPRLAWRRRFSVPQLYAAVVSAARPRSQGRGRARCVRCVTELR
jgi:hypothetical protein